MLSNLVSLCFLTWLFRLVILAFFPSFFLSCICYGVRFASFSELEKQPAKVLLLLWDHMKTDDYSSATFPSELTLEKKKMTACESVGGSTLRILACFL